MILFLQPDWGLSGVTSVHRTLAEFWVAEGRRVCFVATGHNQAPPPAGMFPAGVEVRRLLPLPWPRRLLLSHGLTERLRRRLIQRRYERLLAELGSGVVFPGYAFDQVALDRRRFPTWRQLGVVHSDDLYWMNTYERHRAAVDHWVAVSPALGDRLGIQVIPNGVVCPESVPPRPGRGPMRVLYVGRLDATQKRLSDLARAADRAFAAGADLELRIVGEGPEGVRLPAYAPHLAQAGRLLLSGALSPLEVRLALSTADVFFLASAFEGLPMALLEAMAWGCAPLASATRPGAAELIQDQVTGRLFPVGDIGAAAAVLERWAAQPEERRVLGAAAAQAVAQGPWNARAMAAAYAWVVSSSLLCPP